ncbi:bifunctional metallophosphatase/5'-nucleotidase [Xylanibacillus composti]|uniref:2',3'-cyclic-nucleotide 2'-phosphodiesterase n=1 Tax=Xylanibacillus composti TaxID=1572762 RepID=A0A8J4M311_9BACL|nr:bifunctional UDP-sugar hydrolase/5'-nucleotidase [Xylanibacillus composti]GIQ70294.1 2',3'-cyclic-nucleotide 2'-phosphodiesterase [Xylanibacillus composti]
MPDDEHLHLTILATSDIHGSVYPTDYRSDAEQNVGLAKLAAAIRRERQLDPDLLLIDNGDLLQGTPLATYCAKHNREQIHPVIRALNHLQYDAAVVGNHEFNFGQALLRQAIRDSRFPWLAANIIDSKTGDPAFGPPYIIREVHSVKIAIVGLTTHFVPNWEQPKHIAGLHFENSLQALKRWADHIRSMEQPDVLIAAYHGGFECDLDTGVQLESATGENQGFAMLESVEGIDVMITGHQHRLIAGVWNDTAIIQPGCFGQALGKVRLKLRRSGNGWQLEERQAELIAVEGEADPQILALCREDEEQTQAWLDQPLGRTEGDLRIRDPFRARLAKHPFAELLNRIQMEASGVRISCTAFMHHEAPGFSERITMREVLANYPFANTLKVLRLSGEDIRQALERSASYFTLDADGRPAVHPSFLAPKPQHYNYDMWEGIEYELDVRRPIGQRVVKLLAAGGLPLQSDDSYDVVMNHYRASGGGGFAMFQGKPVIREIQTDMTELIAAYLAKHPVISASCSHNWRVVIHSGREQ